MNNKMKAKYIALVLIMSLLIIAILTPYQESYQTSYQDPVYKTEYYQEAIYVTDLELGIGWSSSELTVYDVDSYSCEYSSTGFWGTHYYDCNVDGKTYSNVVSWNPVKRLTSETKSRQVIDHYDTKYKIEYRTETILSKLLGH